MKTGKLITWGDIAWFAGVALLERPLSFLKNVVVAALDATYNVHRINSATAELKEIEKALR